MDESLHAIITAFLGHGLPARVANQIFIKQETAEIYIRNNAGSADILLGKVSRRMGQLAKDGSTPMEGDLDMGGQRIINIADPVLNDDGVTRQFVDDRYAIEVGFYSGNSTAGRTIVLANTSIDIKYIQVINITNAAVLSPLIKTEAGFAALNSRLMTGSMRTAAAGASSGIQSVATVGEFNVGDSAEVNATGSDYQYLVIGSV